MTGRRTLHNAGFSTADLLAGTALSLMVMATLQGFFQVQQRAIAAQDTYAKSQAITRAMIDLFSREVRMAAYDPTGAALPTAPGPSCPGAKRGIVEATPTRLHFRQDLDGSGAIAAAAEDVTIELVGARVLRTDGANPPDVLVDGIAPGGFLLRYYDGSNPPIELIPGGLEAPALDAGQRDCVAKVRLAVVARLPNPNPNAATPLVSRAESEIAIRNRSLSNF